MKQAAIGSGRGFEEGLLVFLYNQGCTALLLRSFELIMGVRVRDTKEEIATALPPPPNQTPEQPASQAFQENNRQKAPPRQW